MKQTYEDHRIIVSRNNSTKNYVALIKTINGRFLMKNSDSSLTTLEKKVRKSGYLPAHIDFNIGTTHFVVGGKKLGKECIIIITRKKRTKQRLQICIITEDDLVLADFSASTFTEAKKKIYKAGKKIYEPGIVSNSIVINQHNPTRFHLPLDFPFKEFTKSKAEKKTAEQTLATAIIKVDKIGKKAAKKKITASIKIDDKKPKKFTAKSLDGIRKTIKDAGLIPSYLLSKINFGECTFQF